VIATRREGASDTPHYQIHIVDDAGTNYRVAVRWYKPGTARDKERRLFAGT
jgi:hypothetical protein